MKADSQIISFTATPVTSYVSSRLEKAFLEFLNYDEQYQAGKLRNQFDFNRSVSARLLAKAAIAAATRTPVNDIRLGRNHFGRPIIIHPSIKGGYLDFSISHAGSWAVCSLARSCLVGIDIEKLEAIDLRLIEYCLTDDERDFTLSLKSELRAAAFFDIWTCKEAYGKMIGEGITFNLQELDIKFYNDEVRARFQNAPLPAHSFGRYRLGSEYSLSLCVKDAPLPSCVEFVDVFSWLANLESH